MPLLTDDELQAHVALAHRLADAAGAAAMPHFRAAGLATDDKDAGDGFDPVTAADRGAETAMRAVLAQARPYDGVFGEEQARTHGTSGLTWVLDPIDGTRAFISGLPVWGTLIALDDGARGRIGVINQPFTGERFVGAIFADGPPEASLIARDGTRPLRVRPGRRLSEATCFTTDPYLFSGDEANAFDHVRRAARLTRYGTDCYAYALLAMGQVDLVIETGLAAYDIAAHVPLITAAGGVVTDWRGGDCRWGGQTVACASETLHAEVLEILSPAAA